MQVNCALKWLSNLLDTVIMPFNSTLENTLHMFIDSNEQNVQHLFVTIFQELHS